jgi:hypothetical protein
MKLIMFSTQFITNFVTEKFMHFYLISQIFVFSEENNQAHLNKNLDFSNKEMNPKTKFQFKSIKEAKVSLLHVLCPILPKNQTKKKSYKLATKFIKSTLSSNHILKISNEYEKFKSLILDDDQKKLFKCIPRLQIDEINEIIECKDMNDFEINQLYSQLSSKAELKNGTKRILGYWKIKKSNIQNKENFLLNLHLKE